MQQTDSKQFQKHSFADLFLNSCLGKIAIIIGITALILVVAKVTVPSKAKMEMEIEDDIRECIEQCQAKDADKSDDLVRNTMSVFTHADKNSEDEETMDMFWKHNSIEIYRHMFFSTAYMRNNAIPNGKRVGLGVFGLVIPMLDYSDFIMRTGPIRKEYNQRIIQNEFSVDVEPGMDPDDDSYEQY